MPWHLFRIEAEVNPDPCDSTLKGFVVSALSDSQAKAEELARAAVEDHDSVPDAESCGVTYCGYLGVIDRDVFQELGELAQ